MAAATIYIKTYESRSHVISADFHLSLLAMSNSISELLAHARPMFCYLLRLYRPGIPILQQLKKETFKNTSTPTHSSRLSQPYSLSNAQYLHLQAPYLLPLPS